MLESTDWTSMSLPPNESILWVHKQIFFSNFTNSQSQSFERYPGGFKKNPRYLKPSVIGNILKGIALERFRSIGEEILLCNRTDLSKLIDIPEALQKVSSKTSKATHSWRVPVPKRITSSYFIPILVKKKSTLFYSYSYFMWSDNATLQAFISLSSYLMI